MTQDEQTKLSLGFATDIIKQLIALSTAIISLCVAFTDKIFSSGAAQGSSVWLLWALGAFVASIISGILSLMAITGSLGNAKNTAASRESESQKDSEDLVKEIEESKEPANPIYRKAVRVFSILQMSFFVVAVVLSMCYLVASSKNENASQAERRQLDDSLKVLRTSTFQVCDSVKKDTLFIGI